MQALRVADSEWLSSGGKNTNESLTANYQVVGKPGHGVAATLPFNRNETIKSFLPLIIAKIFEQPKYEIANSADCKLDIYITKIISQVPEVEYIILSKKDNYYEIWTVINKLDREVRDRIYDVEYNILQHFREFYFDFHVICRDDKSIDEIFPTNAIIYYRKTA